MRYRNRIIRLIKVYAYSEQLYIRAAIHSYSPVLKRFFEQRAFERMEFIEELEIALRSVKNSGYRLKKLKGLYKWHTKFYGKKSLKTELMDMDSLAIDEKPRDWTAMDEKALKLYSYLRAVDLPISIKSVMKEQVLRIRSGILSMAYLKKRYEGDG